MSRFATEGGAAVAVNMLNSIAQKENSYKEGIVVNQKMVKDAALRLRSLEEQLPSLLEGVISPEELKEFIQEQKDAVRKLAEQNVQRERQVSDFVFGVRSVQQQVQGSNDLEMDYHKAIEQAMQSRKTNAMQIEVRQEKMYRDVAEALGDKKMGRAGGDDDDIELVVNKAANSQGLKCPITSQLMHTAVRNKTCGHVYSKEGIIHHLRNSCECPLPGCSNTHLSMSQLEEDVEMQMNVRKEVRRQDQRQQMIASQASQLVDSDDEEN